MKTIKVQEYHDRDGRIWYVKPGTRATLVHDAEDAKPLPDGLPISTIEAPRETVEYLVGPLVEVPEG